MCDAPSQNHVGDVNFECGVCVCGCRGPAAPGEVWGTQFQEKRSRSEKAILGATLGILRHSGSNSMNCISRPKPKKKKKKLFSEQFSEGDSQNCRQAAQRRGVSLSTSTLSEHLSLPLPLFAKIWAGLCTPEHLSPTCNHMTVMRIILHVLASALLSPFLWLGPLLLRRCRGD